MSGFKIELSAPNFSGNEKKYLTDAVDSMWVSVTGPYVSKFKKQIESYVGAKNAVPMQNATAALHMAMMLNDVTEGTEVIVPSVSFIASVNCVRYVGAEPVFMDCDKYGNMDMEKLNEFCRNECIKSKNGLINRRTNKRIAAVIVTHVFGNMADMESLLEIADKYSLRVIEDAAQALGTYYTKGKYKGRYAGTFGDCGVYSYNANKIITCGSGGTLTVKDDAKAEKAMYLSVQAKDDGLRYIHNNVGYNYMMNNLQAAFGTAQLEQLEGFIKNKEENYLLYRDEISKTGGLRLMPFNPACRPNYWFYTLYVDEKEFGFSRDELLLKLQERKIQTRPLWGLIHKQLPYKDNYAYKIERAYEYSKCLLNIPCGSGLTKEQVKEVVYEINDIKKSGR